MNKFVWGIFFVVSVILCVFVYAIVHLNDRIDWCDERGGLMVKSVDGWKCIKAEVVK